MAKGRIPVSTYQDRVCCCVADQFCEAPANLRRKDLPPRLPTCYRCGNAVCRKCSSIRKYDGGQRRLCNNCQIEIDDGEEIVMRRLYRLAGEPMPKKTAKNPMTVKEARRIIQEKKITFLKGDPNVKPSVKAVLRAYYENDQDMVKFLYGLRDQLARMAKSIDALIERMARRKTDYMVIAQREKDQLARRKRG